MVVIVIHSCFLVFLPIILRLVFDLLVLITTIVLLIISLIVLIVDGLFRVVQAVRIRGNSGAILCFELFERSLQIFIVRMAVDLINRGILCRALFGRLIAIFSRRRGFLLLDFAAVCVALVALCLVVLWRMSGWLTDSNFSLKVAEGVVQASTHS